MSKLAYQRLDDLLELLVKQTAPLSMKDLVATFSISDRTIRTDIANLNDLLKNGDATIKLIRGKGYLLITLSKEKFDNWWNESMPPADTFLTTSEERQNYLLFILFKNKKPLSLDGFLDQLFISKNTFYSYLKTARDNLLPYQLKIINRPNIGFEIIGTEFAKRQAISDLLIEKDLQEYLVGFTEMELALFDNIDLDRLQALELKYLAPLKLFDSDYYHKNILSHFALSLSRFLSGHDIIEFPLRVPSLKPDVQEILTKFLAKVNHTFDVQLTSAEQDYFTYYLASNAPRLVETGVSYISSNKIAQAIVEELLSTIKRTSNFDWVNDSLLIEDLTSHIEGFINMNLMDARRTNPLLTTIIKSFPLAYDLCLTHLNILGKKHGLYFSQDEIGYIALHIAGAMERSSMENVRKFQVILICGTGLAMSRIIEAKINKYYKNKIEVVDRLSYVELRQQDLTTIDFIITTVPLGKLSIPHIYINMAKLDIEINKIENFIDNFRENNEEVYSLFREEFFFCGEFKNKDDLLNRMTQKLNQSDFVSMDFYPSIMERESINQTNINEWLAIPHPMSLLAKRSTVAVGILKNGIDWGNGDLVQFVFLFAITKTDYKETEYIYDLLLSLMEHEDIRNKILEKNTFQNFITQIKKLK